MLNPPGLVPRTGIPAHLAAHMTMAEQYDWHRSFLRRHAVSRRSFLRGSAAAAMVGAASFGRTGYAYAEDAPLGVAGRHVGYGPDAASQLRFSAQLSRNPQGAKVFLDHGPTPALGGTVEGEVRNLVTQLPRTDGGVLAAEQFYVHAPVDGLPGRMPHFYRWRSSDGFAGEVVSANTAMPSARAALLPFRFTMVGDQGVDDAPAQPGGMPAGAYRNKYGEGDAPGARNAENIQRQIVASAPEFHILAGDLCYADTSHGGGPDWFVPSGTAPRPDIDAYNPFVWDTYLQAIEGSAARVPWMFATGNHDMEAVYGNQGYGGLQARFEFSGGDPLVGGGAPGCPSVYSFRYGNVAVLSLDANEVSYQVQANLGYSGGAQTSWVERTLAAYRADPTIDFIVCFYHECAYATGIGGASDGGVRGAWSDLFDRYRVDLVLQGHNHNFERTDPLRAGQPTKAAPDNSIVYPDTDGTTYYVVGGGGAAHGVFPGGESYRGNVAADTTPVRSTLWGADGKDQQETVAWSRVRFNRYSFIRVDVRPGVFSSEMDVTAVDEFGREFDRITYRRLVTR
ncbi:metallophosphoesterase [Nocardia sp. NBC_01327]|uniref:metallophosphoesterase n=1 Tax=Nocardia sp. NBC_01327 TaxID=2903593 RepID=UPI002E164CB6|nr:metallophosphoesterase [Nocardia sp. NBC_01327]